MRLRCTQCLSEIFDRVGYETPRGLHRVQSKQRNPAWHAPNRPWAGDYAGTTIPGGALGFTIEHGSIGFHPPYADDVLNTPGAKRMVEFSERSDGSVATCAPLRASQSRTPCFHYGDCRSRRPSRSRLSVPSTGEPRHDRRGRAGARSAGANTRGTTR